MNKFVQGMEVKI